MLRMCREAGFGTVAVYDGMTEEEIPRLKEEGDRFAMSFEELLLGSAAGRGTILPVRLAGD